MKSVIKFLFTSLFFSVIICSCKKDENKIYLEIGSTNPVLSSSVNGVILPLSFAAKDNEALNLSWTNPNYKFTTGISSQDVFYQIEFDTAGANFTNSKKQTISINKDLNKSILVSELNGYLLNQLQLSTGASHDIEIRIKSSLINEAAILYSNVLKYKVTPYAIPPKIAPPASNTLYITGDATAKGWMNGGDAEVLNQKFTKISTTLYETTVALNGGKSYTFVPVYGNWDSKYSIAVKNDPTTVFGGDFQIGGEDILAPATSGIYKIQVDFQRGKFTITK